MNKLCYILLAVGLGLMFLILPYWFDDFVFMHWLGITDQGLPWPIDWHALGARVKWHYAADNIRLANSVAAAMYVLPKWVANVLAAAWWGVIPALMVRIARWGRSDWPWTALLCLSLAVVPGWFDAVVFVDYQWNYAWGTGLTFLCLWLWLDKPQRPWIMALLGLATGLWHEGMAVPLLGGLILAYMIFKDVRTPARAWMIAGLAAGSAVLLSAGGTATRAASLAHAPAAVVAEYTIVAALPAVAMAAAWVVLYLRRRQDAASPLWLILGVMAVSGVALKAVTGLNVRSAWIGQIAACLGTLMALREAGIIRLSRPARVVAGWAAIVAMTIHLATACVMAMDTRRSVEAITAAAIEEPSGVTFGPLTSAQNAPWWAFGKPYYPIQQWLAFADYYRLSTDPNGVFRYIPGSLRTYRGEGTPLPSGQVIVASDGSYIAKELGLQSQSALHCEILTPTGWRPCEMTATPFTSEADGRTYVLLTPEWLAPHEIIRDVRIND